MEIHKLKHKEYNYVPFAQEGFQNSSSFRPVLLPYLPSIYHKYINHYVTSLQTIYTLMFSIYITTKRFLVPRQAIYPSIHQ